MKKLFTKESGEINFILVSVVFAYTVLFACSYYTGKLQNELALEKQITSSYKYFLQESGINYKPAILVEREFAERKNSSELLFQ